MSVWIGRFCRGDSRVEVILGEVPHAGGRVVLDGPYHDFDRAAPYVSQQPLATFGQAGARMSFESHLIEAATEAEAWAELRRIWPSGIFPPDASPPRKAVKAREAETDAELGALLKSS